MQDRRGQARLPDCNLFTLSCHDKLDHSSKPTRSKEGRLVPASYFLRNILNPNASRLNAGRRVRSAVTAFAFSSSGGKGAPISGVISSNFPAASTVPKNGVFDILIATRISSLPERRENVKNAIFVRIFQPVYIAAAKRKRAFRKRDHRFVKPRKFRPAFGDLPENRHLFEQVRARPIRSCRRLPFRYKQAARRRA